jgi:cytochrome c-type biogenesis protein CcmH/NrfG
VEIQNAQTEDTEAELWSCRRAFRKAPTFGSLRRLASVLSRTARWEMAAEAWLHVSHARPDDADAFAEAGDALSHLQRHQLAATSFACACRLRPDNRVFADRHAAALRDSEAPPAQASSHTIRTER